MLDNYLLTVSQLLMPKYLHCIINGSKCLCKEKNCSRMLWARKTLFLRALLLYTPPHSHIPRDNHGVYEMWCKIWYKKEFTPPVNANEDWYCYVWPFLSTIVGIASINAWDASALHNNGVVLVFGCFCSLTRRTVWTGIRRRCISFYFFSISFVWLRSQCNFAVYLCFFEGDFGVL